MARISITKEFKFSMGHALWLYEGKCYNLHGHNYRCLISISAQKLDQTGFVMDFGEVKERVANVVDDQWDHKTLLNQDDPRFDKLGRETETELGIMRTPWNPTAENLAAAIFSMAVDILESEFEVLVEKVVLWETDTAFAEVSRR